MRFRALACIFLVFFLSGCEILRHQNEKKNTESIIKAEQDAERKNSYGYFPIDPLPVQLMPLNQKEPFDNLSILNSLPDETMRIAIGTVSKAGKVTFGPAAISVQDSNYIVILDYIKFNTGLIKQSTSASKEAAARSYPVYIGVGLRLTANITAKEDGVNLGNLFGLGADVKSDKVTGTLVVQTLGLSGEGVSSIIPIPSEINATTIQNAIMAIGAIKSKMYDNKTRVSPRIVGIYNSFDYSPDYLMGVISNLLNEKQPLVITPTPQLLPLENKR